MADLVPGQLVWSAEDKAEVTVHHVDAAGPIIINQRGIAQRRSSYTLTPLEPRVGDRVRVVELSPRSALHVPIGFEGVVTRWDGKNGDGFDRVGFDVCKWGACRVVLLSRAPSPKSSEPVQPSEPEGWRPKVGDEVEVFWSPDWVPAVYAGMRSGTHYARLATIGGEVSVAPRHLRPISPPPSVSPTADPQGKERDTRSSAEGGAGGGGSSKRDPYAEHREREASMIATNTWHPNALRPKPSPACVLGIDWAEDVPIEERAAWEQARLANARSEAELDSLAASRRKLAQATEQLGRKVERRDPSDWECIDEPTNCWANGRP